MVRFRIADRPLIGSIWVVDKFGNWEDASDVSYDIWVELEQTLYKHIPESIIERKLNNDKYYGD